MAKQKSRFKVARLPRIANPRVHNAREHAAGSRPGFVRVVTVSEIPGFEVKEVKGLVWGTTVRSRFIGTEILAFLKLLLGGEVREYTAMINEARRFVIERMVENARVLGANAVIGTRIGGSSQVVPGSTEIFAYGTAVVIKPKGKG